MHTHIYTHNCTFNKTVENGTKRQYNLMQKIYKIYANDGCSKSLWKISILRKLCINFEIVFHQNKLTFESTFPEIFEVSLCVCENILKCDKYMHLCNISKYPENFQMKTRNIHKNTNQSSYNLVPLYRSIYFGCFPSYLFSGKQGRCHTDF